MQRIKHTSDNWSELDLIREVKKKPILYDKTLKEYRKASVTEKAWSEISESINANVDDIKKRWKSLRDTFIKYYRLELMNDSPRNTRNKTWKFYSDLSYLRPHVELFRLDAESNRSLNASSTKQEMIRCDYPKSSEIQIVVAKTDDGEGSPTQYTVYQAEGNEGEEEDEDDSIMVDTSVEEPTHGQREKRIYVETIDENYQDSRHNEQEPKNIEILENFSDDPDEKFLLSCLPVLKRISAKKNAYLKLRIQTLMYEVEFGDDESPEKTRPPAKKSRL